MRWSIRYQLLVPLLMLLIGVVGMSTWAALSSANRARRQIEEQVRDIVRTVSQANYPLTENVLHQMKGFSRADYLLVRDPTQYPSGALTTLGTTEVRLPPSDGVGADGESVSLDFRVIVRDTSYLCSAVRLKGRANAGSLLYVFYPESLWRDALWEAVLPTLVLGSFIGGASVVITLAVGRRFSRRIQELERRTRLIAAGDFSPMPLPTGDDELRDLGQAVNEMAQRLAQLQETVRKSERLRLLGQVSGGLAHQLRNSVTGARLAVQVHARECANDSDEALQVVLRQLALVEMHLKRFLDLGRAEEMRLEPCPLRELLDETLALVRPQCRHAHIDLRWETSAALPVVRGDASQLGHVFLNLTTNAIEAAGPGGWVEMRLRIASTHSAIAEVRDSGPGPAPEVANRLFEPFVTGKKEGVGLGLAVARQIVQAHHGELRWHREDGATCFSVELPLADAAPQEYDA